MAAAFRRLAGRASMGPRPFSRGNNAPRSPTLTRPSSRFNGATAVQPWKFPSPARRRERSGRFNGATAVQPWKYRTGMRVRGQPGIASMGPRPFSRGNKSTHLITSLGCGTSMGPRPFSRGNPGAAQAPGLGGTTLQWGHGRSAVEIRPTAPDLAAPRRGFNGATAVQPWKSVALRYHCSAACFRFNGATAVQPWKCTGRSCIPASRSFASMGPRPFSRGNTAIEKVQSYLANALQWGHGRSAVEIGPRSGAADRGARRASMGPRPFSRGNGRPDTLCPRGCGGFNGATAVQPWKWRIFQTAWSWRSSFNGATAVQPWK